MKQKQNHNHEITPELREKIKTLHTKFPSTLSLAQEIGVANTTLSVWLTNGGFIRSRAFESLMAILVQYGIITPEQADYYDQNTAIIKPKKETNVASVTDPIPQFPIISDVAASECACYMPIADYAQLNSNEMVGFSEGKPGDFVVRVTGNSMLPWYPEGTLILARPNCSIKNGDRVIAVLRSGEVVFKIFAEKGDSFFLFPINGEEGERFEFKKTDFGAIRAIYGIIQSMRDEKAIDRAMEQAGIKHAWQKQLESAK